jgi:hypothetical protein
LSGKATGAGVLAVNAGTKELVGCDFSGITSTTNVVFVPNSNPKIVCSACKFPSSWTTTSWLTSVRFFSRFELVASEADGVSTAKLYSLTGGQSNCDLVETTSIYRDAGFVDADGDTNLAHEMAPESSALNQTEPCASMDLMAYVDSTGSKTFRVEAVHNFTTAPTKDELWMDVFYLGTANSCLMSVAGGRSIFSTANWTTSTVDWTGASGYSKIKLEETVTVNRAGVYLVRLWLGKYEASKKFIYCPKVEID